MALPVRRPSVIEAAPQGLLLLLLALYSADFVVAVPASACHLGQAAGCYPWGAEGPTPWYYASKPLYLATSAVVILACGSGVLRPFVASGPVSGAVVPVLVLASLLAHLSWSVSSVA
jgi:hypothetical protein